jgi:hypothetical protein
LAAKLRITMKENEELKKRLTQPPEPPPLPPEMRQKLEQFDAMAQHAKEVEEQLAKVSLEWNPQFKAEHEIPRQNLLKQVEAYGIPRDMAERLETLTMKDRVEALKKDAPDMIAAILPVYAQVDALNAQRTQKLANASAEKKRYEDMQVQGVRQFRAKTADNALKVATEKGHFAFAEVEGNEQINAHVRKVRQMARDVVMSDDPHTIAYAAECGVAAQMTYLPLIKHLQAENTKLKQSLQKAAGASPAAVGGQSQSAPPSPSTPQPLKPGESMAARALSRTMGRQ